MYKRLRLPLILIFWLLVWQGANLFISNDILFAGPWDVLSALGRQIRTADFWRTLAASFSRIGAGFLAAAALGIFLGAAAGRFSALEDFLAPVMLLFKSVPVASFVILALIWIGSDRLSVFISFVVVLPILYTSTLIGLKSADPKLLEMCRVYRVPVIRQIEAVYLPALLPHLLSSADSAIGLAIKSGVAAEVIGVPDYSVGGELYMAKIYLNTADLFAWTLVIIAAAWMLEHLLRKFLKLINKKGQH